MRKGRLYALKRKANFPNSKLAGTYVRNFSGKIILFPSKKKAFNAIPTPSTKKYYYTVIYKK